MNLQIQKEKEQESKTLKEKLLEKEKLNCSFIPKLTQSTKKIIKKRSKSTHSDFYNKCISWKNKKERNNQHQYMLFLKKSFEECRFYPKTNKNIHERVIEEMKNKRDDYIYHFFIIICYIFFCIVLISILWIVALFLFLCILLLVLLLVLIFS